ncbi:MAG TPA: collagen-binding domain-containing protein [Caulobacteraceae bacterium]|jgi:choice-of-anchor A domain-containing protein|nr:collagen-binding domain-containing protein [Caulobacteraceae bacterium]
MNVRHALGAGVAAVALLALSTGAHATPTAAQQGLVDLSEFNVIVLGNMHAGQDVEGNAYVGGNLSGGSANFGTGSSTGQGYTASTNPTLTVGGNVTLGNVQINSGYSPGGVTVGGNISGLNLNTAGTVTVGGTLSNFNGHSGSSVSYGSKSGNFNLNGATKSQLTSGQSAALVSQLTTQTSTMATDLEDLSKALAALKPTAGDSVSVPTTGGDAHDLKVVANSGSGYIVIDTTTAVLNSASNQLEETLKSLGSKYVPVIINVTGTTADLNFNQGNTQQYDPYVLWNFENATTIDVPRGFNGAILGVDATLTSSNQIQGSVAVANFNQGGEDHLGTFQGGIPLGVPEPAGWALMMVGMGLTGGALRRRRPVAVA